MSETSWIVLAVGMWLVALGTLYLCAAFVKESDRAQADVLAERRRARFVTPRPRRTRVG